MKRSRLEPARKSYRTGHQAGKKHRYLLGRKTRTVLLNLAFFFFFMGSPLVFVSGFSNGTAFCTLYNLPKLYFIITGIFALSGLCCYRLARFPEESGGFFWLKNKSFQLYALLLVLMGLAAAGAVMPIVAARTWTIYLLMGLFWVVLTWFFLDPVRRWVGLAGLLTGFAIFVGLGLCQAAGLHLGFLVPILGPSSTFGYRNPAGHFIVLVLPYLGFAVIVCFRRWLHRKRRLFLSLAVILGLLVMAAVLLLYLLACRVAFLVLILEIMALPGLRLLFSRQSGGEKRSLVRPILFSLMAVVLIFTLIFAFPFSRKRVLWSWHRFQLGGVAYVLEGRYYHWSNTLVMIREHPLLGVGPGNFLAVYPLYCRSSARDPFMNYRNRIGKVHNDYLQVAAECGIPALIALLFLLGRQFRLLCRPGNRNDSENDPEDNADWCWPLTLSLFAICLIMFFSFPLEVAYSRAFFFFLLALGEARACGLEPDKRISLTRKL